MKIAVFCGSQIGVNPTYSEIAFSLWKELAQRGHSLIYWWVNRGLMERVADGVVTWWGQITGYYSRFLENCPNASRDGVEVVFVDTLEERQRKMFEWSDACIILPGGFWTLWEMAEILILKQMGKYSKPIGICNLNYFYNDFQKLLRNMVSEWFVESKLLETIFVRESIADLFEGLGL